MKKFITILITIIATAAIILAIVPTSFADESGENFLKENNCHASISNVRCDVDMSYTNDNIMITIANIKNDDNYNVDGSLYQDKNRNEPAAIGTPVKFILPDGTVYEDIVSEGGKFSFKHNDSSKNDFVNSYDEKGNKTHLADTLTPIVHYAMFDGEIYNAPNETSQNVFRKIIKLNINNWYYDPERLANMNLRDIHVPEETILNNAKGTFYEDLITEWIEKVRSEKAIYAGQTGNNTPTVETETFKDVAPTHWANASIKKVAKRGAFTGYEDGTFRPENQITHEEFIKVIMSLVYLGDINKVPIHILSTDWATWARPYLDAADYTKIITFADTDIMTARTPITRAEMAKVIARTLAYLGKQVDAKNDLSDVIADWDTIPDEYKPYVAQVYTAGILAGYEDGTFRPDKTLTRAETAAVVVNLIEK